jgi:hypothetical protein
LTSLAICSPHAGRISGEIATKNLSAGRESDAPGHVNILLQVVIDEVEIAFHDSEEISSLEFDILYTHLVLVCIGSNERRCRYVNSNSMEAQLSGDGNRVVALEISVASYGLESRQDPKLTVPHPGTSAAPSVGKFTLPEVRISLNGGWEFPTSHGVRPVFLREHKRIVSSSTIGAGGMNVTKLRPSLRLQRLLSTLLGFRRGIGLQG